MRKYTDYSGDPTATLLTESPLADSSLFINVSVTEKNGKRLEITDNWSSCAAQLRITLQLTSDEAIRLGLRLLPQNIMIQAAQILANEGNERSGQ